MHEWQMFLSMFCRVAESPITTAEQQNKSARGMIDPWSKSRMSTYALRPVNIVEESKKRSKAVHFMNSSSWGTMWAGRQA